MHSLICLIKHAGRHRRHADGSGRERALEILGRAQTAALGIFLVLVAGSVGVSAGAGGTGQGRNLHLTAASPCATRPAVAASLVAPQGAAADTVSDVAAVSTKPAASGSPSRTASPTTRTSSASPSGSTSSTASPSQSASSSPSTSSSPSLTSPGNQTGTVGTPVSLQIHATDSATGQTLTYTATGLPAGLSINSTTGLITGTPTTAVTASVTVTATDTTGAHGSATFTWTINTPPPLLCVTVAPYLSSTVAPGGTASFAIFVWTTNVASSNTSVSVSVARATDVDGPAFAVCSSASGGVCKVGSLPAKQATEMVAGAGVTSAAANGTRVILTATAAATGATPVHADATVTVKKTAAPSPSSSSSLGLGLSSSSLPSLPGFSLPGGTLPDGSFTTPTNPSGLFPTVSPGDGHGRSRSGHGATTDSAILPLDSRLIGWQLAGLAVLASAIAIAVARLSLRARPHDGKHTPTGAP